MSSIFEPEGYLLMDDVLVRNGETAKAWVRMPQNAAGLSLAIHATRQSDGTGDFKIRAGNRFSWRNRWPEIPGLEDSKPDLTQGSDHFWNVGNFNGNYAELEFTATAGAVRLTVIAAGKESGK